MNLNLSVGVAKGGEAARSQYKGMDISYLSHDMFTKPDMTM